MAAKAKAVPNSAMKKNRKRKPEYSVMVAGDELGLGHRHVERGLGQLGLGGDEEDEEADELGEDERVADAAEAEDLAVGLGVRRCPAGSACRPG